MTPPGRSHLAQPARLLLLLALVMAGALASDVLAPPAEAQSQPSTGALQWRACGRFQCATLLVPLDYANPGGRQIELALLRQPARDPSRRIGALLANPGGPGASGNDFVRLWAPMLSGEIRDRFDIVGFDPRGVGASTPLLCHDDIQALNAGDPSPDTPEEWAGAREANRRFAELCAQRGGELLRHLGTNNVVRDLDRIRAAIGDERLTYVGYSYGAEIGAAYADQFPERVRALVLDGAVDLSVAGDRLVAMQAEAFEATFRRFLADCASTACPIARNGDPAAAVDRLLARVEATSIPAPGSDRPATGGETLLGIVVSLYRRQSWPLLGRAINEALEGDGTTLVRLADLYLGRGSDGEYDNSFETNVAVNCIDAARSRDTAHYERFARDLEARAPHFGAAFAAGGLTCAYWAAPPDPVAVPRSRGASVLVVGTTGDPATPYAWSVAVARQLGGTLLTHEGEGHTIYASGNRCIDEQVNRYLLDLRTPEAGTVCATGATAPRIDPGAAAGVQSTPGAPSTPAPAAADTPTPPDTPPTERATSDEGDRRLVLVLALAAALLVLVLTGTVAYVLVRRRARTA